MFGINSAKRQANKAAKELRLASYSLIEDYENRKITEQEVRGVLQNIHEQDKAIYEVVLPFIYHLLVSEHLSRIAVDDAVYKRIKKVYLDKSNINVSTRQNQVDKLLSKSKGIGVLEKRLLEWVCAESFWYELLSDEATNAGFNYEVMLKDREILRSNSLNHVEIPNAWVTRSGRIIET